MMSSVSVGALYALILTFCGVFLGDFLIQRSRISGNRVANQILRLDHAAQYFYLIVAVCFVWIARVPIFIYALPLNPDEAWFTANAMRVSRGCYNWDALDSLTSGPLNSMVLVWPYLFGLEATLTTTRITGTILISLVCVLLFLSLRRIGGSALATLISWPLFMFYGSTSYFDFVHYSSEHASLLLLSIATYCLLRTCDLYVPGKSNYTLFFIAAFSLGSVPFAKLQCIPIAALLGMALLFRAWTLTGSKHERRRVFYSVVAGLLIPSTFFLAPLLVTGSFHHFYYSCILNAIHFVSKPLTFLKFVELASTNYLYWTTFLTLVLFTVVALLLHLFCESQTTLTQRIVLACSLLALPVGYYCVIKSGRPFTHYLHFLLPVCALAAGTAFGFLSTKTAWQKWLKVSCSFGFVVAVLLEIAPAAETEITHHVAYRANQRFLDGLTFHSPQLLRWMTPQSTDTLFVWGWMAECNLATGISPATRETISEYQLRSNALTPYYRERLLGEFKSSKPKFVIDSVGSNSNVYNDPATQSIFCFPELGAIIRSDYVEVTRNHAKLDEPRIYLRKDCVEAIGTPIIEFAEITASAQYNDETDPKNLDDCSVWDFHPDWWALPNGELGYVNLTFSTAERVARIDILNTRHHPTDTVNISALSKGQVVHQKELRLNRYPYWSTYELQEPAENADTIRIEILSFSSEGAGLNEIKAFRSNPESTSAKP